MDNQHGDHGKVMDMCIQQLRQEDSNMMEVNATETDGDTASTHTRESLTAQQKTSAITKGPVRFTQEEDNFEVPTLQV